MYTFLIVVMGLVGVVLGVAILLQSGKGGGLAASFGGSASSTESFLGGRQTATLLTKGSWTLGAVFLSLALVLSILSIRERAPRSVLEGEFRPTGPQPVAPTPLLPVAPLEGGAGQTGTGRGSPPSPLQPEGSAERKP